MDVSQVACAHCGTVNEIITRRSHGDYNPLCRFCQKPVREARKIEFVGEQGGLFVQHIPGKGLGGLHPHSSAQGRLGRAVPCLCHRLR